MNSPEARAALGERLASWYSLAVYPLVALASLVQLSWGLDRRPGPLPAYVVVVGAYVLAGAALLPWLRRGASREGLRVGGVFVALLAWAAIRLAVPHVLSLNDRAVRDRPVELWLVAVPVLQAFLAIAAAWLLAAATPIERIRGRLYGLAVLLVGLSLIGEVRVLASGQPATRLQTGIGGAAVYHLVLLLVLAVLLGAAWEGLRPAWSIGLALVAVGLIAATASRAGAITLGLFLAVLAGRWWWTRRGAGRRTGLLLVGGLVAVVVIGFTVASATGRLSRLLALGDARRQITMVTGVRAMTDSVQHLLFGTGTGTIWPWFVFESGTVTFKPEEFVMTRWGFSLSHPHSTYLGVATELGLVGLALLLTVVGLVAAAALRTGRGPGGSTPTTAMRVSVLAAYLVGFVAFAFDYYLFKSFSLALVWWYVLFLVLRLPSHAEQPAEAAPLS